MPPSTHATSWPLSSSRPPPSRKLESAVAPRTKAGPDTALDQITRS
ncbi:MAG: hypothetical protein U0470_04285 [Anaerolineae bacterium]